jgi:hypothetical protein
MMEDLHHVHGGMALDAPPYEETSIHNLNTYTPYQQLSHNPGPSMSWSTTDPSLLLNEHNWLGSTKAAGPLSWQTDMNYLHQAGILHADHAGYGTMGQLEMLAALNADPYNASVNELSQLLQVYSLYQDHYGVPIPPLVPLDTTATQLNYQLLSSSTECLQVVSSSGSDSLSTTETWKSETSGGCAPDYDQAIANLSEPSSRSLVNDTCGGNFPPQRQQVGTMQELSLHPVQNSWINHQSQGDIGRANSFATTALSQDITSYDVPPSTSSAPAGLPFKRPRTWEEALQQGSADNDHMQFVLASTTNRRLEFSVNSLHRPTTGGELMKTPARQTSLQGKLSANHIIDRAGTSAFSKQLSLPEDGRLFNGKGPVSSVEPQSVAARHRRKKISERIRVLEKLIPGGNKMDTATMLDEAIEYVKFLQLQVQILESDSLSDIPASTATASTQALSSCKGYGETIDRRGLKRKMDGASSRGLSTLRPTASPLILSEVLQQQLFKQKLCLVSIRQCPPQ